MDSDPPDSPSPKKLKPIKTSSGIEAGNPSSKALQVDTGSETEIESQSDDYDEDYQSSSGDDLEYLLENDGYTELQTQFDNLDLPPGFEAPFSWLDAPQTSTPIKPPSVSDLPETEEKEIIATSSLMTVHAESSSSTHMSDNVPEISQFDVVDAFSNHHYANFGSKDTQPSKNWAKKIQDEWKILKNDLPEMIFVRVCETRMELLRAVLVGPSGTPYHDGLFFFDCLFPTDYPNSPPSVYYYSGGLELNPNLYADGKVCLSLLGTWSGDGEENWMPEKSTMLQVLVSIQALILNEKPFFNEPYYDRLTGNRGEFRSKKYNDKAFILSLRTMIYSMKNPPEHFKELVGQHFRGRARNILTACKAYSKGALVGSDLSGWTPNSDVNVSRKLKACIDAILKVLIASFSHYGINCDEFLVGLTQLKYVAKEA